jgi:ribosomal protein S1
LKSNQEIEVMVLWDSVERWLLILSLKRANQIRNLTNLTKYNNSNEIITVRPTKANKWGLLVDIDGLKWFIPVSQLTPIHYPRVEWADPEKILAHLESLVWVPFKVRVINVDESGKKIIFSEKAAIEENRGEVLKNLKEWDIVEWTISGILSYWLFVTFNWLEWLVHVSEIDWWHVTDPNKFAKVWMKVKVKIIWLDSEKISLSIKRLKDNPWDTLAKKYKLNDMITAPISRISKFGAFMDLEWGIQWLIHLSEISYGVVKDIRDFMKVWEEITVKIINFEPEKKRIWLSLKALQEPLKETKKSKDEVWNIDEEINEKKKLKKSAKKEESLNNEEIVADIKKAWEEIIEDVASVDEAIEKAEVQAEIEEVKKELGTEN